MLPVTAQYSAGFVADAGTTVAEETVTAPPTTPLMALKSTEVTALHCITGSTAGRLLIAPALASMLGMRIISTAAADASPISRGTILVERHVRNTSRPIARDQ